MANAYAVNVLTMEQKEFIAKANEGMKNLREPERNARIKEMVMEKFNIAINREDIRHAVRECAHTMKANIDDAIKGDFESRKEKREEFQEREKNKVLMKRVETLQEKLDNMCSVRERKAEDMGFRPEKPKKAEATALWVASDWHMGEVVEPEKVNGLNEHNATIAAERGEMFFKNALRLTEISSKDVGIRRVVLAAIGDFIGGYIHPELMESNELSPIEELMLFRDVFNSGLRYALKNSDLEFSVVCKYGNHGRTTEKSRISTGAENSYEYLIYNILADDFKDEKRVKFVVEKGDITYLPVYGQTVRFMHGDNVQYGGGIGGIHIPLRKAISQLDKARHADLTVLGHFHQLEHSKAYIVNGSNIGYGPYSLRVKADFERPQQAFALIDSEWGKTITAPIRVTKNP